MLLGRWFLEKSSITFELVLGRNSDPVVDLVICSVHLFKEVFHDLELSGGL